MSSQIKKIELRPIKESTEDYEEAEKRIKELFRKSVYLPLIELLGTSDRVLRNSDDDFIAAIQSGRITFSRGLFFGKFNASISKTLRILGATWDKKREAWAITKASLPPRVIEVINQSAHRFEEKLKLIDKKLAEISPDEVAGKLKVSSSFDKALWKVNKDFQETLKGISIAPKLSDDQRKQIAAEWETNMKLYVKGFLEEEITELRQKIKKQAFAGNRYESTIKTIERSYGVGANKAKFLARQETSLLMTKFKQVRYQDAGVDEYTWNCVAGSKNHPVRPAHRALQGKTFRWDDPPITTAPGEATRRNNPGQDYNCRCFARPVVRFVK